ncbi:MAG: L-histidine N(alpha)-methyltransferase [Chloroflexi bacterium]|nr:MAG: L-histidine N(alpha)-methyltransferase [Chloroflexota bacterium]
MSLAPITIAIHTFGREVRDDLVRDVCSGLGSDPKSLPPRWFYDERGSELFEAITRLPEYYQTRTETAILREAAPDVIARVRPEALVELGAGSAEKTRLLIEPAVRDRLACFVPFDISEAFLQQTARRLATDFPGLAVYAVVGDFSMHVDRVPRHGQQLVVFLGSTIGNFDEGQRARFLGQVRALLQPGDAFLLGVDLVKDEAELVAAYNDSAGVTAQFNCNLLRVLNRELGADFDLRAFEHVASFDREHSRIEMRLRARTPQRVTIPEAGMVVDFAAGEALLTEISVKFTRGSIERELEASGLGLSRWYTDPRDRFALCLCVPSS